MRKAQVSLNDYFKQQQYMDCYPLLCIRHKPWLDCT